MPITAWYDIAGLKCDWCGAPATHFYGTATLCCQCHGGNVYSVEETKLAHDEVAWMKSKEKAKEEAE